MAISGVPKNEGEMDKKAEAGGTMPAKGAGARKVQLVIPDWG